MITKVTKEIMTPRDVGENIKKGRTNFKNIIVKDHGFSCFRGVCFENSTDFSGATFEGIVDLAYTIFKGTNISFEKTTFKKLLCMTFEEPPTCIYCDKKNAERIHHAAPNVPLVY